MSALEEAAGGPSAESLSPVGKQRQQTWRVRELQPLTSEAFFSCQDWMRTKSDRQANTVCYDGCLVFTLARRLLLGGEVVQMALAISVTYQPKRRA